MRALEEAEEKVLIEKAKSGNASAYEALVRNYQHRIYRLCLAMTGTHPAADDLAQEDVPQGLPGPG